MFAFTTSHSSSRRGWDVAPPRLAGGEKCVEEEKHFVPLEVPDDAEIDNSVFFFRVVGMAVFTLVGATGGAFAAA